MKKSIYILFIVAIGILLFIPDIANAESVGVFSDVQDRFEQAVSRTSTTITNQANWLFWVLAAISLVWTGITLVFRKGDISDFFAEFIRFIIFIGFFNWLLNNGHQMAKDILSSFSTLGSSAIGESDTLNPSGIMDIGFNLWERTYPSVSELSLKQIIPAYLIVIAVVIIVGLIAVNVLLLNVSAWIFAYAGVFVLGFGEDHGGLLILLSAILSSY
ncbi:TPA: P-type conjugative transfer protein TrbL [Neisseria gonorrhoeae]